MTINPLPSEQSWQIQEEKSRIGQLSVSLSPLQSTWLGADLYVALTHGLVWKALWGAAAIERYEMSEDLSEVGLARPHFSGQ